MRQSLSVIIEKMRQEVRIYLSVARDEPVLTVLADLDKVCFVKDTEMAEDSGLVEL